MANVNESSVWEDGIFQVELTTPLMGGEPNKTPGGSVTSGHLNVAAQQLANRTSYLKDRVDSFDDLETKIEDLELQFDSHVGSRGNAHTNATQTEAGFMSAADKTKLNGITAGAEPNQATNLSQGTRTSSTVLVNSSTGTSATLDSATTSLAGLQSATDKAKLNTIQDGAQVNQNAFTTIAVTGQTSVVAASPTDTLTIVPGTNITITTNESTDTITINSSAGTEDNTKLPLTGGTLTGDLVGTSVRMLSFIDKTRILGSSAASQVVDLSQGDVFDLTLSVNTSLSVSGLPPLSGAETLTLVLRVRQSASTLYTISWFSGISWLTTNGSAPPAPAIGKIVEYIFTTTDGVNWLGRKGAGN